MSESSSSGENHEIEAIRSSACAMLFKFRVFVCSGTTDFKAAYKSYLAKSVGLETVLDGAMETRRDMIAKAVAEVSVEEKLRAIDNYLPHLYIVADNLIGKPQVQTDRELAFQWVGVLSRDLTFFKSNNLKFELLMVLEAKAIEHNHLAAYLLARDGIASLTDAGKHLTIAAGIMNYIESKLLMEGWSSERYNVNPSVPNLPEIEPRICSGLAALFMGCAQTLSVVKALSMEKRPPALVLAKLCVGVSNTMHKGITCLDASTEPAIQAIMTHMIILKQFFGGLAYRYSAQAQYETHETGKSMGSCVAGKKQLARNNGTARHAWLTNGMPPLNRDYMILEESIKCVGAALDKIYHEADRDNRFIYFQEVPEERRPPNLPPEASVMTPIAFIEPERTRTPIEFIYSTPPSIFSSIFTLGSSISSNNPTEKESGVTDTVSHDEPSTETFTHDAVSQADLNSNASIGLPPAEKSGLAILYPDSSTSSTTHQQPNLTGSQNSLV